MVSEIEDLKKKFIVNKKEYEKEKLPSLVEKALKYCKVDETGLITIENPNLKNTDKIKIVLIARFLANKLDQKIPSNVNVDELSASTGISDKNIIYARISELIKQKICFKNKNKSYELHPYQASILLDKVDKKYRGEQNVRKR